MNLQKNYSRDITIPLQVGKRRPTKNIHTIPLSGDRPFEDNLNLIDYLQFAIDNNWITISGSGVDIDEDFQRTLVFDPNGDNSTAVKGTTNNPYLHLSDAGVNHASSGDTFSLKRGDYIIDGSDGIIFGNVNPINHTVNRQNNISLDFDAGSSLNFNIPSYIFGILNSSQNSPTDLTARNFKVLGKPNFNILGGSITTLVESSHSQNEILLDLNDIDGGSSGTQLFWGRGQNVKILFNRYENLWRYPISFNDAFIANDTDQLQDGYSFIVQGNYMRSGPAATGINGIFQFNIADSSQTRVITDGYYSVDVKKVYNDNAFQHRFCNMATHDSDTTFNRCAWKYKVGHFYDEATTYVSRLPLDPLGALSGGNNGISGSFQCCDFTFEFDRYEAGFPIFTLDTFDGISLDRSSINLRNSNVYCNNSPCFGLGLGVTSFITNNSQILIEDCYFLSTSDFVGDIFDGGGAGTLDSSSKVIFKNCRFETLNPLESCIHVNVPVVFQDCVFLNDGVTDVISSDTPTSITFLGLNYSNGGGLNANITTQVGTLTINPNVI